MRYGLLGGSFDPIHVGHVAAALAVRAARELDRVYLVPAARPPHKGGGCVASFAQRVAMTRLVTAGHAGLGVLDLEGRLPGPSYTLRTVQRLRSILPGDRPDLLVGADMLEDLPSWYRARELVRLVTVVAFARPGQDAEAAREKFRAHFGEGRFAWVEVPPVDASSTEIRRRFAAGDPPSELLAAPVFTYIERNRLYRG